MKYKLILLMLLIIPIVSSQEITIPDQRLGVRFNIIQNCLNSTYSNLTTVYYPNMSIALNGSLSMNKSNYDYSYPFTPIVLGKYSVYGLCNENGVLTQWQYSFKVKNSSEWIWITLLVIAFLFLILSILVNEEIFVYLSGLFFLINGINIMINGIDIFSISDLNIKLLSYSFIGLGILLTVGAYIFNLYTSEKDDEEEF